MSIKNNQRAERNFAATATALTILLVLYVPQGWSQVSDPLQTVKPSAPIAALAADTANPDHNAVPSLAPVIVTGSTEPEGYLSKVMVGGKQERSLREIPNSVSVITRQRIEEQNLSTVTEVLNQMPGVTAISNDSTQSQFYSRGYALGVAYDGIPARTGLSGYQQIDLPIYERVEVLRGPAGVLQGSDEPGGVVNLVRKRAKADFGLSGSISAGSWNNYRSEIDVTGPLNEARTVRARAVLAAQDRDYFYDATRTRKWLGYGTLEWDLTKDTTLSLIATGQEDKTPVSYGGLPAWTTGGLLDVPRSTNPVPRWSRYEWRTQDLAAELEHRFNPDWSAKVKLSRRDQSFFFKDSYASTGVNPVTQTLNYARRVSDVTYQRDAVDVFVTGAIPVLGRRHDVLFGYNYDKFSTLNVGVNAPAVTDVPFERPDLVPDFDLPYNRGSNSQTQQSGFYGQVRLNVTDPLKILLGGRLSQFKTRSRTVAPGNPTDWATGAAGADNEFTPYAGAVYDLTQGVSLYASYASIFIPQTQSKVSGETIDPREGRQYEVGAKSAFFNGALNASIALFNLRDTNRSFADPDHLGYYINAGEVESKGWEFEVSGSPMSGYNLQLAYSRQDTVYLKDLANAGLQFQTWQPRHTVKVWGTHTFSEGALQTLTLGLGANLVSKSKAGNGSSEIRSQDGYAVVNALASYPIDARTTVSLNVNNLFDKTYYTRLGGTNTYNSYGEPRNVAITLRTRF